MYRYIIAFFCFCLGLFLGYRGYVLLFRKQVSQEEHKLSTLQDKASIVLQHAQDKAILLIQDASKTIEEKERGKEKEWDMKTQKYEEYERKIEEKEGKIEKKREELDQEKEEIREIRKKLNESMDQQVLMLETMSGLSQTEAKSLLFKKIEIKHQTDLQAFIEKYKIIKQEEAEKEGLRIIAQALPRIASDHISEYTVVSIDIPSEDYKGRLIGREGRNIAYFEKMTGCELLIDDTPGLVRISSFDHEKRYIAVETVKAIIADAKINPYYIEKKYKEFVDGFDTLMIEKGKEALQILNIPLMKPEVMKIIGQFSLRYSYGQNLWTHSIEVAKISEALAAEMHIDTVLAKKAGLFHDIGKISAQTGESHAAVGGTILRKLGMDQAIINAAESHHYDVPMTGVISWIVTAADGMSGARPGARFNSKDVFMEKMGDMEKMIKSLTGVEKVHIMQAGREIMVYLDPEIVDDQHLEEHLEMVADKIEDQLDYPGIIRITAVREKKIITFVK